jgi:hypothetical protein
MVNKVALEQGFPQLIIIPPLIRIYVSQPSEVHDAHITIIAFKFGFRLWLAIWLVTE